MTYTASIETADKGTFVYGFHLGTDEQIARSCAADLMSLIWTERLGRFTVRTVGLLKDGALVDVFDGGWASDMDYWTDECVDDITRQIDAAFSY